MSFRFVGREFSIGRAADIFRADANRWEGVRKTLIALAISVLILTAFLLALGADPLDAYNGMVKNSIGGTHALAQTLSVTTPLVLAGLAATIPFAARIFNIGGAGQLIMGAVGATVVAFWLSDLPPSLIVVIGLGAGSLFGALWGLIAGALKAYTGANEVIITLMQNFIAALVASYVIASSWADKIAPQTQQFPSGVELPNLWPGTVANIGILLALAAAVIAFLLLYRTPLGFGIRATGFNPWAARLAGYRVPVVTMAVLAIGGAFAGLAGSIEAIGTQHALVTGIDADYGFTGIAVALVARLHPLWVFPAGFFFAAITVGANSLPATTGISASAALLVLAVFVISLLALRLIRVAYPEVK